jgi:serine/threonine protein kinase
LLERVSGLRRERYRAFDPRSGPNGDFFLVQRLPCDLNNEQQLQVLCRLRHDNFPRIWEWQRHQNGVDVVLSWIEGIPLEAYFTNIRNGLRPAVDPGHAVRLIHGLANGIAHLHRQLQIVHGDIQPANVLLTSHPSRLTLVDFGTAWTIQRTFFRAEGDGFHRAYAAPELQNGLTQVGFTADQFAITVLLYELLTGALPYEGLGGKAGRFEYAELAGETLQMPSEVSRDCRKLPRALREGIDRLCRTGLSLKPDDRYPGPHDWLNDLFAVSAQFRLISTLPKSINWLSRFIRWWARPSSD